MSLEFLILTEQQIEVVRADAQEHPILDIAEVLESDLQLTEADYAYLLLEAIPSREGWQDTGTGFRLNTSSE